MPIEEKIRQQVIPCLAPKIREAVSCMAENSLKDLEEIRLRLGQPVVLQFMSYDRFLGFAGEISRDPARGYIVTEEDISRTLAAVSGNSVYAFEEELRRGFITIPGGHRVGLAGKTVLDNGQVASMKDFSGLALRIARDLPGCGDQVMKHIMTADKLPANTLLVSPPRCGKTTILRDIARQLSNCCGTSGVNVVVVDERSEIAGCFQGRPQLDVGIRTDILDGCPKAEGIMMAIRALAPQVIIADEVGQAKDVEAIRECLNAGVRIITSAHGSSLKDVARRPVMQDLLQQNSFQTVVVMSRRKGPGTVDEIISLDRNGGITRAG
ncbi:MAG: stage III sporulation protein AA [Chitinophagales bacterium]